MLPLLFGAYRECGILPGEEMIRANSTASVIRRDNIPSGKHKSGRVSGARDIYADKFPLFSAKLM
jgi:hypothetical protein